MSKEALVTLTLHTIVYNSSHTGSYTMLLGCEEMGKYIPVVIGINEARNLALITSDEKDISRPMMYDTAYHIMRAYDINIDKVLIHKFIDGVFHSYIYTSSYLGEKDVIIDSRTSDAVALALKADAPISSYPNIVEQVGIVLRESPPYNPVNNDSHIENTSLDIEQLRDKMERAVSIEDYEQAAKLRDQIKKRETGHNM